MAAALTRAARHERVGRRGGDGGERAGVDCVPEPEKLGRGRRRVDAGRQRRVKPEQAMQPAGRARLAATRKMLGVAQRARVLAQPRKRRAGVGGFQRETLTQAAGEDRLAAFLCGARNIGAVAPRRIWSNSARPAPAEKIAAPGSAVCGRAQRGRVEFACSFAVRAASARRARGRARGGNRARASKSNQANCMAKIVADGGALSPVFAPYPPGLSGAMNVR